MKGTIQNKILIIFRLST